MPLTEDELQAASLAVTAYPKRFRPEDERGEHVLEGLAGRGYVIDAGDGWYQAIQTLIAAMNATASNN